MSLKVVHILFTAKLNLFACFSNVHSFFFSYFKKRLILQKDLSKNKEILSMILQSHQSYS